MTGEAYLEAFDENGQAARLIPCLWSLTQPTIKELPELLKKASNSDLEDDFEEFLNVDAMTKAGLLFLGFPNPRECKRIFEECSGNLPTLLEKLAEQCDLPPLLEKLAKQCDLKGIGAERKKNCDSLDNKDLISMLLAEAAVYLLRSKNELKEWCRLFLRVVNEHPEPYKAIQDVLCNAMQGTLRIVNHYQSPHRTYNEAEKCFMSFMSLNKRESEDSLWKGKRQRMVRALQGE